MSEKVKLYDGYGNVITGMGGPRDKSVGNRFAIRGRLPHDVLDYMYELDGMHSHIVDVIPDDSTQEDPIIKGLDEDIDIASVMSKLDDLDALCQTADAWRWARLHGGSLLVTVVNDGGKLDTPMNLKKATNLVSLNIVESTNVVPSELNPALGSRAFRQPEFYDVTVPFGAGGTRRIHRSRVIRFDGVRVPPRSTLKDNGWGPSVLDRVVEELENIGLTLGYSRNIMHEMSITILKMVDFRKKLCGTSQDEEEIRKALENWKDNIDNLHVGALDAMDDIVEHNRNVSGICDLLNKFEDALVRGSGVPRTRLFNEQPSGMNANAASEFKSWSITIANQQKKVLRPAYNRILEILFAIERNKNRPAPTEWTIEFHPLWQESEKEQAEAYLKRSQGDELNILNGVMTAEESRLGHIQRKQINPIDEDDEEPVGLEGPDGEENPEETSEPEPDSGTAPTRQPSEDLRT